MNFVFGLLALFAVSKEPQTYYYDGRTLVRLDVIEIPNLGYATLKLLVNSPFELRGASVDSSEVQMCLPEHKLKEDLKLSGRWYMIMWETELKVGSTTHTLYLTSYTGRIYENNFVINVEGSKRLKKPQGVDR